MFKYQADTYPSNPEIALDMSKKKKKNQHGVLCHRLCKRFIKFSGMWTGKIRNTGVGGRKKERERGKGRIKGWKKKYKKVRRQVRRERRKECGKEAGRQAAKSCHSLARLFGQEGWENYEDEREGPSSSRVQWFSWGLQLTSMSMERRGL